QIRDDILGIWGTKESMGKSVEGDIQQRKKTLPVIYALNTSGSKDKAELERLYSQGDIQGENISTVVRVLVQSGAKDYSQNLAEQYYHRALEQLEASGVEKHRQAPLKEMARFLLERDY
ncbi:MAG: polyprenyl synthetase family protein, partial [Chloroflexota bacterium]|nr:polyprenyl synthetase family protein [Chloroflexota bacterium]